MKTCIALVEKGGINYKNVHFIVITRLKVISIYVIEPTVKFFVTIYFTWNMNIEQLKRNKLKEILNNVFQDVVTVLKTIQIGT